MDRALCYAGSLQCLDQLSQPKTSPLDGRFKKKIRVLDFVCYFKAPVPSSLGNLEAGICTCGQSWAEWRCLPVILGGSKYRAASSIPFGVWPPWTSWRMLHFQAMASCVTKDKTWICCASQEEVLEKVRTLSLSHLRCLRRFVPFLLPPSEVLVCRLSTSLVWEKFLGVIISRVGCPSIALLFVAHRNYVPS